MIIHNESEVVLVGADIAHQDVVKWSEQAPKTVPVDRGDFQLCSCDDCCGSWRILEQCQFTEVITRLVLLDLFLFS